MSTFWPFYFVQLLYYIYILYRNIIKKVAINETMFKQMIIIVMKLLNVDKFTYAYSKTIFLSMRVK